MTNNTLLASVPVDLMYQALETEKAECISTTVPDIVIGSASLLHEKRNLIG